MRNDEYAELDRALEQVRGNPNNNFQRLLEISIDIVRAARPGKTFIADDLFITAINRNPALQPDERRVMGAVMKALKA